LDFGNNVSINCNGNGIAVESRMRNSNVIRFGFAIYYTDVTAPEVRNTILDILGGVNERHCVSSGLVQCPKLREDVLAPCSIIIAYDGRAYVIS
jgi:hypothetical protein